MPSPADTHLVLQARLRGALGRMVGAAWAGLPGHDRADVDEWLATVLPLVAEAQRQSVALTDAYVARVLGRAPLGLDASTVVGAAVRNGADPAVVYHRPFVQMWQRLGEGVPFEDALQQGRNRAVSTAEMDVQLAHRAAYDAIQDADPMVRGWRRRASASACEFCRAVNGAFVKRASAMALHNHCSCGLEPELREADPSPVPEGVAVHTHGELGPVLAASGDKFTGPDF